MTTPAGRASPALRATAALVGVLVLGAIWNGQGAFFRPGLHLDLLGAQSVVGLCALGQCLVILAGGIDLSVGAIVGLCGMVFAGLQLEGGAPWPLAVAAALLAGGLVGAANGLLVARARVQPFLATLVLMVIARGLARWVPELAGKPASAKFQPLGSEGPPFWSWLDGRIAGVPTTGLVFALCALFGGVLLHRSVFGRHVLAVGGNPEAARLSGLDVPRITLLAYVGSGLCAALAGICQVARDVQGNPAAGEMLELNTIAAVVVGGTSLRGGRGGLLLAVLGVLTIGYLEKVLALNGVPSHWRLCVQGVIILAAVLLQERRP
jgi:ribose transport system permease protein